MARHSALAGTALVLAALAIAIAHPIGLAGGKLDPVKVQASASKADATGKQTVTVQVNIEKGWHIYANPVGNEDLAPAQTVVQVKAAGKQVAAKIHYPAGTAHTEKGVGSFKVYEESVAIRAEVEGAEGLLEVSVRFQACDAKKCLPPRTVKVSVP